MSGIDEARALEQVIEGLVSRFPSTDPTTVREIVGEVYGTFDGPVRDYVPLLVQRASIDRLRSIGAAPESSRSHPRRSVSA